MPSPVARSDFQAPLQHTLYRTRNEEGYVRKDVLEGAPGERGVTTAATSSADRDQLRGRPRRFSSSTLRLIDLQYRPSGLLLNLSRRMQYVVQGFVQTQDYFTVSWARASRPVYRLLTRDDAIARAHSGRLGHRSTRSADTAGSTPGGCRRSTRSTPIPSLKASRWLTSSRSTAGPSSATARWFLWVAFVRKRRCSEFGPGRNTFRLA